MKYSTTSKSDCFIRTISHFREKILIEEIHNLYGNEVMEMIEKKDEMQSNVDTLKGTVQLTDLIIKGKDMELLLLQKEIQEKLHTFSKSATRDLPKTATKVIHFVPGMLDMGYIHDADRPLLSQARHRFSHQGMESGEDFDPSDCFDTVGTQTNSSLISTPEVATNTQVMVSCDIETQTEEQVPYVNGYDSSLRPQTISGCNEEEESSETTVRRRRRRREREKAVESETVGERQSRRGNRHNHSYDED